MVLQLRQPRRLGFTAPYIVSKMLLVASSPIRSWKTVYCSRKNSQYIFYEHRTTKGDQRGHLSPNSRVLFRKSKNMIANSFKWVARWKINIHALWECTRCFHSTLKSGIHRQQQLVPIICPLTVIESRMSLSTENFTRELKQPMNLQMTTVEGVYW